MDVYVEPIYRHLKKSSPRGAVGVDLLTVTPVDEAGNTCLIVVVVFYTKYVWATPAKEYTAHTVATALFTFFCTFGVYDELWSVGSRLGPHGRSGAAVIGVDGHPTSDLAGGSPRIEWS